MSSRRSSVRVKVVALLLSLVALWAFAASVTLREGLNLLSVATLASDVGSPTDALVTELQRERRLSLVFLAGGVQERSALATQRRRTDDTRKVFNSKVASGNTPGGALGERIGDTLERLDSLGNGRAQIDAGVDRGHAAAIYTDIINAAFRIYGSMATLDDPDIAKESRTLVALSRAREVLSQEDALLAGVLAAGKFSGSEHEQFVELAGAQRFLYAEAEAELPADDRSRFQQLATSDAFSRFQAAEDRVIDTGGAGFPVPTDPAAWNGASGPLLSQLQSFELKAADGTIERAKPAAAGVILRLALAGGLGLIAVIASIVMSITTARSLVQQLEKLRAAALGLANERLPGVVERLRRGEEVDVATEAPPLAFGTGEIGEVGRAFNLVQETAIAVAVEQAELRRGIRDVFLSLARRTQALVHRQLALLDAIERRETKPEELEDLFRVDHLATRMRRNAENLIVLSGAVPGRGWRNPVPLVDVVRGAVAEVEDYARVSVASVGRASVAGRSVGDIIHLLAELVENAASFSPPHTTVEVSGQMVANGFVIEIEDRGLGMNAEDLAAANEQLANPPEFNLTSTARLGLYVVGRLAERHNVRVQLRHSAYGGTAAVVLLPRALVIEDAPEDEPRSLRQDHLAHTKSTPAQNGSAAPSAPAPVSPAAQLDRRRDRLNQRLRPWKLAEPSEETPPGAEPAPAGVSNGNPAEPLAALPAAGPVAGDVPDAAPNGKHASAGPDTALGAPAQADAPVPASAPEPASALESASVPELVSTPEPVAVTGQPGNDEQEPPQPSGPAEANGAAPRAARRIEHPTQPLPQQPPKPQTENGLPHTENGLPQRHRHAMTRPEEHPAQPATGDGFAAGRGQQPSDSGSAPTAPAPTAPAPAAPAAPAPASAGLPQRVRQASLAVPLRSDAGSGPDLAELDDAPQRAPEEIRRKMASYQLGTVRGRLEAENMAAALDNETTAGQPGDAPEQEHRDPAQHDQPHADRGRHAPLWSGPAPGDR